MNRLIENHIIFYIALFIPFLNMFLAPHVYMIRGGLVISVVSLLIIAFNFKNVIFILRKKILFSLFIIIELVSIFGYYKLRNEIELSKISFLILSNINYLLLPQLIFFITGVWAGKNKTSINRGINIVLNLNFILISLGILLYVIRPSFYLDFIEYNFPAGFVFYGGFYPRLISFLGDSMSIGVLCSSSFVLSIIYTDRKWKRFIYPAFFLVGCIMSMQRGAWLSISMGLFLLFLWKHKMIFSYLRKVNKNAFFIILFLLLMSSIIMLNFNNEVAGNFFQELGNRFGRISTAISERTSQWENVKYALDYSILFGKGLGTLSHKAVNVGLEGTIPDGNYFRIIGENGILGASAFFLLLAVALLASYFTKEKGLSIAICIYVFQAIGNNVFDLYYASFIFWYILGICHSNISYYYHNGKYKISVNAT